MRDYGKVFTSLWASETFRTMSEDGRSLVLYLLTCPHGTITGTFRLPDGYACEDLQWTAARVAKAFAETVAKGFANRCETTKWVWVCKYLEWNPPENPNQRKSAAKQAAQIPADCCWKRAFMRDCRQPLGIEAVDDENPCATLVEGFLNQEQEQEQEEVSVEAKASTSSAGPTDTQAKEPKRPTIPCPYEALVAAYHEALPTLPKVLLRDGSKGWPGRQKAMRELWGFVLSSRKSDGGRRAETAEQALQWIAAYFVRASENDFIMGRTQRGAEHANWRADFDYLLTERGMKQVIEKTREAA
jgi:hypothetical protein